jgi:hypothetical protein
VTVVDLPRWDALPGDRERCVAAIDAWADALLGSGALEAFDGGQAGSLRSAGLTGGLLLDALDRFASEHWDFRGGRERNLAADPALSAAQEHAIDAVSSVLGLDGTSPPSREAYDAVVMTGGMVRAGIVKPRYLRELHDLGLDWREGVFLGGFRRFAGDEFDLARALGVAGDDEFDAMSTGMRRAFGLGDPTRVETSGPGRRAEDWREECWEQGDRTLRVVAAPSSEPAIRRANTIDTYRFWAARAGEGIRSVLVITTPVYVPYQGAGAIEVLGLEFGLAVETVAVSARASDLGENSQAFLPRHRAQELRSAVHGMRGLRHRLAAPD